LTRASESISKLLQPKRLMHRPTLKPVSTAVYTQMVRFKLLPPLPPREAPTELREIVVTPTPESAESDRRKALALKQLEERMRNPTPTTK
jgi:hypothetical protein